MLLFSKTLMSFILSFSMWTSSTCNIEHFDGFHFIKSPMKDSISRESDTNSSSRSNFLFKSFASKFARSLKDISDTELGVSFVQDLVNSVEYKLIEEDEIKLVKRISQRLETKVNGYLSVINYSISLIQHFKQHSSKLCYFNVPCIYISGNGSYEEPVNFNSLPLSILNLTEGFTSYPELGLQKYTHYFVSEMEPEKLTHVFSETFKNDNCMLMDNPHFQRVFLKTVSKVPKQLVLIVDTGGTLSTNQFTIAKALASHIILALSPEDRISLLAVSDSVISATQHCTHQGTMAYASDITKHHLTAFIDDLAKSTGGTNHTLGFLEAFKMVETSMKNESVNSVLIVYISRGLMSSITEARTVMEVISHGQDTVAPSVQINTCALIDDEKSILYEKHFLSVVAQQNYSMYNMKTSSVKTPGKVIPGSSVSVSSISALGGVVRTLLSSHVTNVVTNSQPVFFTPQWNTNNKGDLVISIASVVNGQESSLLGVVGIDVPLEDLAEDIIFFNEDRNTYAFLMDVTGKTLAHPLLKQPYLPLYEQPVSMDISYFETSSSFSKVKDAIFQNSSGSIKFEKEQTSYRWQRVSTSPYVVVTVSRGFQRSILWSSTALAPSVPLVYHRLDLTLPGQYNLSRNYRQLSSLDAGSVFLSAQCFQSPFKYLMSEHNVSRLSVQSYMAYLKDSTSLLANPGLHPAVRAHLVTVDSIIPYWKKLYIHSSLTKYIIRKYIVTGSGAVLMYPAGVGDHRLDVLKRSWYLRAVQSPGMVTVTAPYLDAVGAGYIVTISIAVGQHPLLFVLALDVTLGAMYKLITDAIPSCSSALDVAVSNVKCFLMEDRGYLVTHPSLVQGADEHHQQHITHMESLVANDLLNHKGLVKKLVCNDFASNTVQRWYQFNLSTEQVVTNMISGEQCVRYQLTHLSGTNIFLGVVNTTCDLVTAFCPCNTIDRHCLNCNRMEQNECECPCECPLQSDDCSPIQAVKEPCPPTAHPGLYVPESVLSLLATAKPCYQPICDQLLSHRSCLGVIGCEWCQLHSDGVSLLSMPFCAHQDFCYNGIATADSSTRMKTGGEGVPFSSMGGAMFALLVALSLMVYCYCKHSVRPTPVSETSFHMFTMDQKIIEEPPTGANTGLVSNAQELSVALLSPATSISPYRMSSGYRRPPTGDSDHGYSTMTPHEDTEPPPTPPPFTPHHTLLPHRVIAPVTVHMAMDT